MARAPLALLVLFTALLAGACASSGASPKPFPGGPSAPGASATRPPDADRDAGGNAYTITRTALSLRGVPYRNGGTDPHDGFDCSGFTQYVFAQHGYALPRATREQYHEGRTVRPKDVVAGDLLFFTTTAPGPTHVGIALGGDAFIHAPSSTGVVRIDHLSASYWSRRFLKARRID
jgi:cell wall-associated NlpC family hydrolase